MSIFRQFAAQGFAAWLVIAAGHGVHAQQADGAAPASDAEYAAIVEAAVERHILPIYRRFRSATEDLAVVAGRACDDPASPPGAEFEAAFRDTVEAWAAARHLHWGPARDEYRYERIALGADPRDYVGRQLRKIVLTGDPTALDPGRLGQKSIAVQGLTALEHLLFAPGAEGDPGFRCRYRAAIAENLAAMAADIVAGWSDDAGYPGLLRRPGPDNPLFRTPREAAMEVFKPLAGGLRFFIDIRLFDPLRASVEEARPRHSEFWRSGGTNQVLRTGLAALADLYRIGFSPPVAARSAALDARVRELFAAAAAELDAIALAFDQAVLDGADRRRVEGAIGYLNEAWRLIAHDVAAGLGLAVGFNEFDGD